MVRICWVDFGKDLLISYLAVLSYRIFVLLIGFSSQQVLSGDVNLLSLFNLSMIWPIDILVLNLQIFHEGVFVSNVILVSIVTIFINMNAKAFKIFSAEVFLMWLRDNKLLVWNVVTIVLRFILLRRLNIRIFSLLHGDSRYLSPLLYFLAFPSMNSLRQLHHFKVLLRDVYGLSDSSRRQLHHGLVHPHVAAMVVDAIDIFVGPCCGFIPFEAVYWDICFILLIDVVGYLLRRSAVHDWVILASWNVVRSVAFFQHAPVLLWNPIHALSGGFGRCFCMSHHSSFGIRSCVNFKLTLASVLFS